MKRRGHAVLLRGVNLGARNKLPMPALRAALTEAGYDGVSTLLQSGNLVVVDKRSDAAVAAAVHDLILSEFALDVPCLAIDQPTLRGVVDDCPMPREAAEDGKLFNVLFLGAPVTGQHLSTWDPRALDEDNIHVGSRAIYQWCPTGFHRAPQVLPQIERRWKVPGTVRNWNTTTALLELLEAAGT